MLALDDFINRVDTLPAAPRILADLFGLLLDDEAPAQQVVELISFDPAFTAKVLQRCNSAVGGQAQPIHDMQEAVSRLGFNEIFRLLSAIIGEQTFGAAQRGYGIAPGEMWQHSVVSAVAAQVISRRTGENENLAFTAALLHDIGKLVLSASLEVSYQQVVDDIQSRNHSFVEAEKALLGVEHAEVGGRLLERWRFPENLVRAVWHHHQPSQAQPHQRLAASVLLSDLVAHFLGHGHGHNAYAVRADGHTLDLLNLSASDVEEMILETEAAVKATPWFAT